MMFACGKLKGFFQLSIPLMRNVKYPLEVKLLRSEVPAGVGGTLNFTLFQRNNTSL